MSGDTSMPTPHYDCTCTGGPYLHGPEGRKEVLARVRAERERATQQPDEADSQGEDA